MTGSVSATPWQATACILCPSNCGIEVQLEGRRIARVRGDRAHPGSKGYACEKAQRLDYYQNGRDRLTSPLRRRPDGRFEPVDWDTAIAEVAERLLQVRDTYGGKTILYYGGGTVAAHLAGAYSSATRAVMGSVFRSNAIAQEKTGEAWVDGRLFGRGSAHGDFEHAEVAVFVGKNPWQSHGFPHARPTLKAMAADPNRSIVVIDPRRTETAEMADYHLAVRPGTDAFCLAALLAAIVQEELIDTAFLADHTVGAGPVLEALSRVPIVDYCRKAGVSEEQVREVARRVGHASSVAVVEDLGVEQAPHSTLNSYLEKLLYLLTGNFGKPGGMALTTNLGAAPRARPSREVSPVLGWPIISGLVPCNIIPDEILTDHPDRYRAMFIEAANPVRSLADSQRMREALAALEFVVVIDVAMTETARCAHYVLPAASQFEKCEASFFTFEFPRNVFQLRAPVLEPLPGTLPEPEIHRRLVRAMGALTDDDLAGLRAAARAGRPAFAQAFAAAMQERPSLSRLAAVVLYETLGETLPAGMAGAAVLWGAAHACAAAYPDAVRRAGFDGDGFALGEALFDAILTRRSGVPFTVNDHADAFAHVAHDGRRINLEIPELLGELERLREEDRPLTTQEFPLVLSAGERRSSTANTILRDPAWRKKDSQGALRVSPVDAERLGLSDGARARVTTKRGSAVAVVEVTDAMQPGHVSLPNGFGLAYPDADGQLVIQGVPPNELTASEDRDWIAGTPWHKHVPARVEAVG